MYLLSSGRITSSETDHLIDSFITRAKLSVNEIPHSSNNGITKVYNGISDSVISNQFKSELDRLALSIDKRINITDVIKIGQSYKVIININNNEHELFI